MEVRSGYKQTEVGVIPEDWDAVRIGDLFTFKNGLNKAKQFFGYGTPIVNYMDVFGRPGLRAAAIDGCVDVSPKELSAYEVRKGDVFFTRTSETVEEIGIASVMLDEPEKTVYSGFVLRARPIDDRLDDAFKAYCFSPRYFRQQVTARASYTTRALTNGRYLSAALLARPPKSEQRAIAVALSDVDALLDGLDRLIAKKRDLKQAAMQQLLTGQTRLPGFHGEWGAVRLADVSFFITKGSTPTTYGFDWQLSGVLFLRSECVSPEGLDLAESMFISAKAHRVLRRSAVRSNDLLITITGNVGRVVRLPGEFGEANINQHIARIRIVDEATHPGWVYHFLAQPEMRQHFEKITTGQAYPQISLAQVRDAVIPRPAIGEQREISATLDDMDGEIAALEARRDKTRGLKQAMMQELLTGKTRLVPAGAAHA